MPKYLDEDQVGQDAMMIGFPHLLLCQGVVCVLGDGSLVGRHFTTGSTENQVAAAMQTLISGNGTGIQRMYVAYDSRKKASSAQDAQGKAGLFNFHGDVYFFDCSKISPKDGTFVQVTSRGPHSACLLEYKRNEKMQYTVSPVPGTSRPETTGARLAATASKLHKAGHTVGMKKYTT